MPIDIILDNDDDKDEENMIIDTNDNKIKQYSGFSLEEAARGQHSAVVADIMQQIDAEKDINNENRNDQDGPVKQIKFSKKIGRSKRKSTAEESEATSKMTN